MGHSQSSHQPRPLMRRCRQPLVESARTHLQASMPILVSQCVHVLVHDLGCVRSAPWGAPYLMLWRGGRPTVPTVHGCRHKGK
jgi:hypothetical protein